MTTRASVGQRKNPPPTGLKPMTFQIPGGRSIPWSNRTHGEQGHLTESFNHLHSLIPTHDDFDSADPSSIQDACPIWTQWNDLNTSLGSTGWFSWNWLHIIWTFINMWCKFLQLPYANEADFWPNIVRLDFRRSLVSEQQLVIDPKYSLSSRYQPLPRSNCPGFRLLEESGKIGTTAPNTLRRNKLFG